MPNANILTYSSLSNNYPAPPSNGGALIGGMCKSYENQCAIRLSRALDSAGLSLEKSGYSDPTCAADGITHGRGAESLANFLWRKIGIPERDFLCKDDAKFKNRKGIIFFKDIDGGALDHIDLWDGKSTIGYNGFNNCKEVWFWSLPRTI